MSTLLRTLLAIALLIDAILSPSTESRPLPHSTDYDTTHRVETRKYLKTYGLIPPAVESFENQSQRGEIDI